MLIIYLAFTRADGQQSKTACHCDTTMMAMYDALNPPALARLLAAGVQLRAFSEDIMVQARQHSNELMEENAASNASYNKVYSAWKTFRDESYAWFATAARGR